ncbi:DNA/RNA non-specific endonuclease [Vibrio vulnificus]|nr:DNA/RNA non-specific endonuclease [Vibrio vulnificus]MDS1802072.1 DNA/RNA non-specific endonuclease [Vibrio vulnificus]
MGKPAATITSMHICPKVTAKVPHVGGPVVVGSPNVKIGGLPAARKGDRLVCVGPPDSISQGSSSVFINGKPAARMGDGTAHGGKIVIGNPTVLIGDSGGQASTPKPKRATGSATQTNSLTNDSAGNISREQKPIVKVSAGKASGIKGKQGSWASELEPPAPNTLYEVTSTHEGSPVTYTYETDAQGRTIRVTGKLQKSPIKNQAMRDKLHRNSSTQSKYGGDDPNYDGGHLIATLFQGPAEKVNLVPQLKEQNRHGEWRQMEKRWSQALDEGKDVEVDLRIKYGKGEAPSKLISMWTVNGGSTNRLVFKN